MDNNELISRYVYAVTKNLPSKIRDDVAKELNSLISDMLEERCGSSAPNEQDVKAVLISLGTPSSLAEKYNPDSGKCLIGSPYYAKYKFVLKIVLACVAFGLAVSGVVTLITGSEAPYIAMLEWFASLMSGFTSAFAFVTILFAVFYHKKIKLNDEFEHLNNLPPVPKNNLTISKWEALVGIIFSVLFAVVFLFKPEIFGGFFPDLKTIVPVFNAAAIKDTWYIIISLSAIGILKECVKIIEGRYTTRLMLTTILVNIISLILIALWLSNENLINPDFTTALKNMFQDDSAFLIEMFSRFRQLFLGLFTFVMIIDSISVVAKTIKSNK